MDIVKKEGKFPSKKKRELWQVEVSPRDQKTPEFDKFVSDLMTDTTKEYGAAITSEIDLRRKGEGSAYFLFPNENYCEKFRNFVIDKYENKKPKSDFLGGVWIRKVEKA